MNVVPHFFCVVCRRKMAKNPGASLRVDYFKNEHRMFIQRAVIIKYMTLGGRLPTQHPQRLYYMMT